MPLLRRTKYMNNVRYLPHNIVGHPMMAILELFGMYKAANWIHDITLPKERKESV